MRLLPSSDRKATGLMRLLMPGSAEAVAATDQMHVGRKVRRNAGNNSPNDANAVELLLDDGAGEECGFRSTGLQVSV